LSLQERVDAAINKANLLFGAERLCGENARERERERETHTHTHTKGRMRDTERHTKGRMRDRERERERDNRSQKSGSLDHHTFRWCWNETDGVSASRTFA